MKRVALLMLAGLFVAMTSCKKDDEKTYVYKDGSYKAEESEFSHGYKAFMEAQITKDVLVTVNFDYVDSTGNLKSETTSETYPMVPHPSEWIPTYDSQLLATAITPDFVEIDGVTGATHGKISANLLMEAILNAAKTGDTETQVVVIEK
jgi:major membrane immunogen (membrane-anchored lipoprotein)